MLELGATFRKTRESQNVSIEKIAKETRINSRFLEAIENERFDLLPGGIFNRGFIRSYALRLGLDPEEAIQGYEKLFHAVEAEPVHQETERVRGKTTKIPVYYVALAGLLVLIVVFYFLTRHKESPLVTPNPPTAEAPAPPPPPVPAPVATSVAAAAVVPTPVAPAVKPVPVPAAAPVFVPAATPAPVQASTPATGPIVVELEVREESWFKLSSDGSDVVTSEVLAPGTVRRYTAANSINISIGNAAGVALRVNGEQVSSLGRSGQVRNMTITSVTTAASLNAR